MWVSGRELEKYISNKKASMRKRYVSDGSKMI